MLRPKLSTVTNIPLMDVMEYFKKKYSINTDAYWNILIDDHMFRGNDTSKSFYCKISNEIPGKEVAEVLPWPDPIKALILEGTGHPGDWIFTAINSVTVAEWAELYKLAVIFKKNEERNPTIKSYWPEYLVRGTFEAMVLSEYQLETDKDVFYYISW